MTTTGRKSGLTRARERIGITQKALAEVTGIKNYDLSKIESGKRAIKDSELLTLAYALGVAPSALIGTKARAQLRPGDADPEVIRQDLEVFDRFIRYSHYLDGLAELSGQA